MRILRTIILAAGALVVTAPVLADPPWARGNDDRHEGRREKEERHERHDERREHRDSYQRRRHESFNDDDRVVVRDYYHRHQDHVPPGLAKKGGVPPGLAKKGEVLDVEHTRLLVPVPPDLDKLLPPPPHEVIRRILGRDIIMIHKQTHKVLDVLPNALP